MNLDQLCQRRVAIWGLGQEGLDMVRLLADRQVTPLVVDDDPEQAARRLAHGFGPGHQVVPPRAVDWTTVDAVVRAPGVSRYRAELGAASAAGVEVTTAMALWFEDFAEARVLAVTGTKGKSTTATLAAAILRADGFEVDLIGNIGVPVTATYGRRLADAYVVEVSSYQAADVTVTPGVCVLTSLAPDHLDWHGDEETYYRDKLRLIEAGPVGALAVNAGSDEAVRRTASRGDRVLFGPTGRVRADPVRGVEVDGSPVVGTDRLRVPGRHNQWNLCGAIAGALLLNGRPPSTAAVGAAVDEFEGLPSRCRTVGQRAGLTFVDDALASNPFATQSSVEAFADRDLTLILGGADRGVDPGALVEALTVRRPAPVVIVLGREPRRLYDALDAARHGRSPSLRLQGVGDLDEAVALAVASTPPGGVVLFSPAAPTPEGGGGFTTRSRQFVRAAGVADHPGDPSPDRPVD